MKRNTEIHAGFKYQREAKYDEAEQALRRALVIWQKQTDPQPLELATTLNNLASLYTYRSRFSEAEPLHRLTRGKAQKSQEHGRESQRPSRPGSLVLMHVAGSDPKKSGRTSPRIRPSQITVGKNLPGSLPPPKVGKNKRLSS